MSCLKRLSHVWRASKTMSDRKHIFGQARRIVVKIGLGAEIGISTSKLHAFGPMGLEELTTTKFIAFGNGQIRES